MAFVDAVLKEEVNGLIGPYIENQDEFISGLASYQQLSQMDIDDDLWNKTVGVTPSRSRALPLLQLTAVFSNLRLSGVISFIL